MYKVIDWPDTCYIQEAAYWLAFGRVPDYFLDDDGADQRQGEDARYSGEIVEFDWGYSEAEFRAAGVSVDYERYSRVFQEHVYESADDIKTWERRLSDFREREDSSDGIQFVERQVEEARAGVAAWDWRRSIDDLIAAFIDNARAKIFQALFAGELTAIGWREYENNHAADEMEDQGEFITIDKSRWSLRHFDWEKSELVAGKDRFRAVQVSTDDLLSRFPAPLCEPLIATVRIYPGVAIINDDAEGDATEHALPRPRGRPAKGGGAVQTVVQNFFGEKIKQGAVPQKREALIQDVIDFVKAAFKEDITRSTAQRYLQPLLQQAQPA